jgi:hypothetical protein
MKHARQCINKGSTGAGNRGIETKIIEKSKNELLLGHEWTVHVRVRGFDCYGSQLAFFLNGKKENSANSASIHLAWLGYV